MDNTDRTKGKSSARRHQCQIFRFGIASERKIASISVGPSGWSVGRAGCYGSFSERFTSRTNAVGYRRQQLTIRIRVYGNIVHTCGRVAHNSFDDEIIAATHNLGSADLNNRCLRILRRADSDASSGRRKERPNL